VTVWVLDGKAARTKAPAFLAEVLGARSKGTSSGRREVNRMLEFIHAMREREEGQALVEYALILSLIAVVCIGALTALGVGVSGILSQIAGNL